MQSFFVLKGQIVLCVCGFLLAFAAELLPGKTGHFILAFQIPLVLNEKLNHHDDKGGSHTAEINPTSWTNHLG